jgi:c-di-GMP-binding flagellar brake protein YcgR
MTSLPQLNDPVLLRDHAGRTYRSRVEGVEPGVLTVARPLDLPVEHDDAREAGMQVTWRCGRGIAVVPTRLLGTHVERGLALWSMAITGAGWVEQRRSFVRVPASGLLTLRPRDAQAAATTVTGRLVDLSEAALRCAVDAEASELLSHGTEVSAGFRFGTATFTIPASIGPRRPSARSDELAELLVVFEDAVRHADALRKEIFAQQRRALRAKD